MSAEPTKEQIAAELQEVRLQLEDANDTIHAIRTGMVDAFVVQGEDGHQLYTLKSADQTFRVLIEKMQEGAITLSKDGIILYCNSSFAEMAGVPLDQVIGAHFNSFIQGITFTGLNEIIMGGKFTDYKTEDTLTCADGTILPVLLSLTNLSLEDGTALSVICTDLTAQKDAQRRATDIDNQRKAIEQKDEFIGIASHELKTPLTSLKAYMQLILAYNKDKVPEQIKTFISKAEVSISKLQTLVNDLLDVSKIQAGKLHFSTSPLYVNKLVSSCIENASYMFPDYHIVFTPEEDFVVNGNTERLEQVLMNMINNAVKYSPQSKDVILSVEKAGANVKISVTDYGIGLSAEQQDRIFERFYRVDDKNFMVSGLGMGLYISKEIINNHKGRMGVVSKINQGATFYITLPL
ncbi:PAS domain-containing sensor histidine kinase [Pedobacter psychroterrae]|uniref:histidine kinase n=1 Tax=Pedobacter psychroterrae TaxID=2530453 RepID=A0A4R0NCK0_9SPHI|nr:PAS domain-containing sensor histidine kinase [Pedobacter psychroterrae]TCC98061.1 PAS domain-containing sensor histidine kinase [Pedobacter psychroterrae]